MGVVKDSRPGGLDLTPWGKYSLLYNLVYSLLFHQLDGSLGVFLAHVPRPRRLSWRPGTSTKLIS